MASSSINLASASSSQGLDVTSTVQQLIYVARAPERLWQNQQQTLQAQASALNQLNAELSSLSDAAAALKDPAGALSAHAVTVSASGILTASAQAGTVSGAHVVSVQNLSSTSSYYTQSVATRDTQLAPGSFVIQVGSGQGRTLTIDGSNNTLDQLAAYINDNAFGVHANVITDATGARLALVSDTPGASGDITITADPTNGPDALSFAKGQKGVNASITFDGVPVSSATNHIDGVVPGLTMDLTSAAPGTQLTLDIAPDSDAAVKAVNDFVTAYNAVVKDLNQQGSYNSTTKQSGVLSGDPTARLVQGQLLGAISTAVTNNASFHSLAGLGISMNDDGTLAVNSSKLDDSVKNHFADVQTFFQSSATSAPGFAVSFGEQLGGLTDPTEGAFYVELKGNGGSQQSLQHDIDQFEVYIADRQQQLMDYYNRLNVMLQQFSSTQSQLKTELDSLSSSSS